jgi:transcriptional regulator with XRE-family HTH domain
LVSLRSTEHTVVCGLLKALREEAGLTQIALAELLEVDQTFISKAELGERRIDLPTALRWGKHCGVKMRTFLNRLAGALEKAGL